MARTNGIGVQLHGKLGNLVFVNSTDGMIVRTTPARRSAENWSDKQKESRKRFSSTNLFYRQMKAGFVDPIWKLSARPPLTGYNLFMGANLPAFDAKGVVTDESLIHFSCGSLPLPQRLQAEWQPGLPDEVLVSWDPKCFTKAERSDDELCLVLTSDPWDGNLSATGIERSAGSYRFMLTPLQLQRLPALWLFFRRKDGSCYSDDKYIRL